MIGVLALALAADPELPPGPARCTAPRPCHLHSAADFAAERLVHAMETQAREDLLEVAELYARLVAVTPDPRYDWHRANALFSAREWVGAERAYAPFTLNEASPYHDAARFQVLAARKQVVLQRHGAFEALPGDASVEAVVTTAAGKSIPRYTLSPELVAFIASADDLVSTAVDDPQVAPLVEVNRVALMYLPAQILDVHGHNAEARQRYERIIAAFPKRQEAVYAAAATISTYLEEGDREAVERLVEFYERLGLWPCCHPSSPLERDLRRAYKLAQDGDRSGAVAAYRAFLEAYPASRYRSEVLSNLANSLDILGLAAEARQTWLQFRSEYPEDVRVPGFLFRIADSYIETQDLDEAIATYLELQRTYPEYKDASSAVYNAAFLLSCLGRHADAARAFTTYADTYPTESDAEFAAWRATQEWAKASEDDGLAAYQRYLARYPKEDGDHLVEGWYQLARLYEARGDTRRASDAWEHVQRAFDAAGDLTTRARGLAATQPLARLSARVEAFERFGWTGSYDEDVQLLSVVRPEELRGITLEAQQVMERYQDPESIAEATYRQGAVYFAYADATRTFPHPASTQLDQELEADFRLPAEERGRDRLLAGLRGAAESRRWSEWNTRALVLLHERYPGEFPAQRPETWGRASTWEYAGGVAMSTSGTPLQRPYEF